MTMRELGAVIIETTEIADQPGIFRVDVGCENRLSAMSATTNKDETTDQFCMRLKGILRSLLNEPSRVQPKEEKLVSEKVAPTWDETKRAMKDKRQATTT